MPLQQQRERSVQPQPATLCGDRSEHRRREAPRFDKFHNCPRTPGEPACKTEQYASLTGFGVSVPAHGDDHAALWLDSYLHYDKDHAEYPGLLQIGLRMPDGEVALNGSHNLGMWSLAQKPAASPNQVAAIGLAVCCDPATVAPCPAECAGTADTPRMVLVSFEDVIGQPANYSVEWAGTLEEAGIGGSLTTGAAYDVAGKAYYHAAMLNGSTGPGIVRFDLSGKPAKLLPTWPVTSGVAPLALRFQ